MSPVIRRTLVTLLFLFSLPVSWHQAYAAFGTSQPTVPIVTWEYAWDSEKAPFDFLGDGPLVLPELAWKSGNPANPPDRNGRSILWLRTRLPESSLRAPTLFMSGVDQAFEVFLHNKMIYRFGSFDAKHNIRPEYKIHIFDLPLWNAGDELIIRAISKHVNIGVYGEVRLGDKLDLAIEVLDRGMSRIIVSAVLLAAAAFVFLLFLRKPTERPYLFFSAFAASTAIHMLMRTEMLHFFFNQPGLLFWIEMIAFYTLGSAAGGFTDSTFGPGPRSIGRIAWRLLLLIGLSLYALALAGVVPLLATLMPFQLAFFVLIPLTFIAPIRAALQRNPEGIVFAFGILAYFLFGAFDILAAMGVVPRFFVKLALFQWGTALFTGSLATILAMRFLAVYRKIQDLKDRLEMILEGTRALASIHDKIPAASKAVQFMLPELSLGTHPNVHLFVRPNDKKAMEALLLKDGEICSVPDLRDLSPEEMTARGIDEAFKHDCAFADERGTLWLPLVRNQKTDHVLALSPYKLKDLPEDEAHFADALGISLATTLENISFLEETADKARIEGEIMAAEIVQKTLLPENTTYPFVEIATHFQSAAKMGGDWYGCYYDERTKTVFFYVGDVTGHGIPSALLTGVVCGVIYGGDRLMAARPSSFSYPSVKERLNDIAKAINTVVYATGRRADRVLTMAFMGLNTETGELTFLNAGHNLPWVWSPSMNKVTTLRARGNRLGFTEEPTFESTTVKMSVGDTFFVYTDGLIENSGPDQRPYPERKLKSIFQNSNGNVHELKQTILSEVQGLWGSQPLADDYTMLIVKWTGQENQ